jgi:hypothetical protein
MGRAGRERHSVATRISWGTVAACLGVPVTAPVAAQLDVSDSSNQLMHALVAACRDFSAAHKGDDIVRKGGHPYALR